MKEWLICGNKELSGTIKIEGAKNSLVAILPAAIITKSIVRLDNITPIQDTYSLIRILKQLNVRVIYDNKSKMIIDARDLKNVVLKSEDMTRIRASYYFMGALLALYKDVSLVGPGGCKFASRPIDLHLAAFKELGCNYTIDNCLYHFQKGKIVKRQIRFDRVSVGATINAILASCRVKGNIKLINVAKEPEIDDLINFLNKCGACINRDGDGIYIKGRSNLHGCDYKIMEDRIEAGTYLIIGACIGNNLKIEYHQSEYLKSLIDLLLSLKVKIKIDHNYLIVSKCEAINDIKVICDVYPSIPTDLQQPLSIFLSRCMDTCQLKDNVYPSRYTQIEELNRMGFKMKVNEGCLIVNKSLDIKGKEISCKDLRGGASLIVAALIAKGETKIREISHIERGYFKILDKLKKIGAKVYEKN